VSAVHDYRIVAAVISVFSCPMRYFVRHVVKGLLLWLCLVCLVILAVLYLPLTQNHLTRYLALDSHLEPASVIVVLGGGVTDEGEAGVSTRERVQYGAHLFKLGFAEHIILTGGDRHDGFIEADLMRQLAIEAGVDSDSILTESSSTNTYQNVLQTKHLLLREGLGTSVLLVTSPYHMRRAYLCSEKQGLVTTPAPVVASEVYEYGLHQNLRNISLLVHELLGLAYYKLCQRI